MSDSKTPVQYKYHEDLILQFIQQYIEKTYSQHYVGKSGIQAVDVWKSLDIDEQSFRSNILKYAMRYKQKQGQELSDLMKIIHYSVLLLERNHLPQILKVVGENSDN